MNTPETPPELRMLRDAFRAADPVPDRLLRAAYAAPDRVRDWAEAEPAALELVSDSAETTVPTRFRGSTGRPSSRVLTFAMPGRFVEVELTSTVARTFRASGIVISRAGQQVPSGHVVVRSPAGHRAGELDEHGGFSIDDVPSGPLSVVFQPREGTPAVAGWLVC